MSLLQKHKWTGYYEDVDSAKKKWLTCKESNEIVTGSQLIRKAKELAKELRFENYSCCLEKKLGGIFWHICQPSPFKYDQVASRVASLEKVNGSRFFVRFCFTVQIHDL